MTRKQVQAKLRKSLKAIGLEEMQKRVGKTFFEMDYIVKVIYYAILSGKNVILFGPGGFGKSQVVKEFLKCSKISYSTVVGYEDMDVEALLGLPNIPKMLEESTYETSFDKTVFSNPGVLVLEEFLDVNPRTAVALKDILTEGGLRQGDKFHESLITSVIICSNKAPQELSVDLSTTAFYRERFPIVYEVKWERYDAQAYLAYIQKVVPEKVFTVNRDPFGILAELCARHASAHEVVSPRIVKDAIDLLEASDYDISILELIDGIDTDDIQSIQFSYTFKDEKTRIERWLRNVDEKITDIMANENKSTRFLMDSIADIDYILAKLNNVMVTHEDHALMVRSSIDKCDTAQKVLWTQLSSDSEASKEDLDTLFEV